MKFSGPTPRGCNATASQSQNLFFGGIGFSAVKCIQFFRYAPNKKTDTISGKAL